MFTPSLFTLSRSCLLVISKSSTWPRHSLFAIIVFVSRSTFYFCQSVVALALMCVVCGIRRMSKIMSITRSHPVSTLYSFICALPFCLTCMPRFLSQSALVRFHLPISKLLLQTLPPAFHVLQLRVRGRRVCKGMFCSSYISYFKNQFSLLQLSIQFVKL